MVRYTFPRHGLFTLNRALTVQWVTTQCERQFPHSVAKSKPALQDGAPRPWRTKPGFG